MIIYKLTSPSNKSYIGITSQTLEERIIQHTRNAGRKLRNALKKYPIEQWKKEIIDTASNLDELCNKEIYYIKLYNTIKNGYNTHIGGYCGYSGQVLSEDHKQNISNGHQKFWSSPKGEIRKQILSKCLSGKNNPMFGKGSFTGKKHSDETKEKISLKNKGKTRSDEHKQKISYRTKLAWKNGCFNNRPLPTEEQKQKISLANLGKIHSQKTKMIIRDKNSNQWQIIFPDNQIQQITNLNLFCKENNLDQGNMVKVSKGILKQHKGFKCIKI